MVSYTAILKDSNYKSVLYDEQGSFLLKLKYFTSLEKLNKGISNLDKAEFSL